MKRLKKKYIEDNKEGIPKRTKYNWRKTSTVRKSTETVSSDDSMLTDLTESNGSNEVCTKTKLTNTNSTISTAAEADQTGSFSIDDFKDSDSMKSVSDSEEISSYDSNDDCESFSEVNDSYEIDSNESSDTDLDTSQESESEQKDKAPPSTGLLSCFLRNGLSSATCKDILATMKNIFPESDQTLDYDAIWNSVNMIKFYEYHYCTICLQLFPQNPDEFRCSTTNCPGLRYKGDVASQTKKGRTPQNIFVLADVEKQLQTLLSIPGIFLSLWYTVKTAIFEDKIFGGFYPEITFLKH